MHKRSRCSDVWPINELAAETPLGWTGWPERKRFALVLSHDVDTLRGHDRCLQLADIEERLGFRSAFYFVAEGYPVAPELRAALVERGFEIGVHGLTHDSSLYNSRGEFLKQAARINEVLARWDAVGFRSPCMYHRLDWMHDLHIEYDSSTFDTDPFEPQPDGLHTIFPLYVPSDSRNKGYVELPYTLPQDFTLFILMKERSVDIWKRKLNWIAEHGGLALLNVHPDYLRFGNDVVSFDTYPVNLYRELLEHVRSVYGDVFWHVLPRDLSRFWRNQHGVAGLQT